MSISALSTELEAAVDKERSRGTGLYLRSLDFIYRGRAGIRTQVGRQHIGEEDTWVGS